MQKHTCEEHNSPGFPAEDADGLQRGESANRLLRVRREIKLFPQDTTYARTNGL